LTSHDDYDYNLESRQRDAPSPPMRGTTLLDRLTEPGSDSQISASSLRDRVKPPLSGIAGLPPRPPTDLGFDDHHDSTRRRRNMKKGKKSVG
jgi:hypothetical protein